MGGTKKEFLWSYAEKLKQVHRVEREIKECRLSGVLPSKPNDGMPHGSSKGDLSSFVERCIDLEDRLKVLRREAVQAQANILYAISLLEDEQEREVLRGRYIDLLQWGDVAEKMDVSIKRAQNIHGSALRNLKIL